MAPVRLFPMESLADPFSGRGDPELASISETARKLIASSISSMTRERRNLIVNEFRTFALENGRTRPHAPKYDDMWDMDMLFQFFKKDFWLDKPLLQL